MKTFYKFYFHRAKPINLKPLCFNIGASFKTSQNQNNNKMKKGLSLTLVLFSFIYSFSAPVGLKSYHKSIPEWDRGLYKTAVKLTPSVVFETVTIVDEYNVIVRTYISERDYNNIWRAQTSVIAEQWTISGMNPPAWHPVTYLWDIDIPAGYDLYDTYITLPRKSRFYSTDGGHTVNDSQVEVYNFYCLTCS